MKKVGRQVLFQATTENTPRNGEGTFLRLKDGRIMYLYTKFSGEKWFDHCNANIVAIYSDDEGETWGGERIIIGPNEIAQNHMCPNLVRADDGGIVLVYGEKHDTRRTTIPWCICSYDEGETWTQPVRCTSDEDGYYIKENDHMIKLSTGRIVLPINDHPLITKPDGSIGISSHGKLFFVASDDNGKTWFDLCEHISIPFPETSNTGLQETTVYELADGSLRAFSRTDLYCQYECSSTDQGKSWTTPKPNRFFSSPTAPMLVRDVGDMTVAVFNPIPMYTTRYFTPDGRPTTAHSGKNGWGRTTYVMAVSRDGGREFTELYWLEDDDKEAFCYPAIFDGGDYLLIAYYHANGSGIPLTSSKMIKVMKNELTGY